MSDETLLKVKNITKRFPGVTALDNVSFEVKKGTVHALMGENGAGKSTLMKILTGIYQPEEGEINFKGETVRFLNPEDALKRGISMIHQELNPIMEMDVASNIFLSREPLIKGTCIVDKKQLYNETRKLLLKVKIEKLSPKTPMKDLSIAECQMVEIAKAISYESDLIIMDEPTSAITESEVKILFELINELKNNGITIIYISHKLDEIYEIADHITVFRDGRFIITENAGELQRESLIKHMVGRELKNMYFKEPPVFGGIALEIKGLSRSGEYKDISFKVRKGEILGIAGLMGAGRTEIVKSIFGMTKPDSGLIFKEGVPLHIRNEADAIDNGIVLATEDRRKFGLNLNQSISFNISLPNIKNYCKYTWIRNRKLNDDCKNISQKLKIKTISIFNKANTLSGGNQQKVVLAKWLLAGPDVFIFDEPTRGIDVGAKAEIYKIMDELAQNGKAIIMISSEMPEIIGMSDRVVVIRDGKLVGELSAENITQENIMKLASY